MVQPGILHRAGRAPAVYRERFTPAAANLRFLTCGEFEIEAAAASGESAWPDEEALLFVWKGRAMVRDRALEPYDVLYLPRGAPFSISNTGDNPLRVVAVRAPAAETHPEFHARFAAISADESRIRRLKGKTVYLMFDVSEPADKLVAGYTFFEPHARSWPPHNHTDQEEVYFFLEGRGSMEVYDCPENLTFVHNVAEGDAVTIPFLNYHPVFSQADPLCFIWAIAGARYWVGDRNKDFLAGGPNAITT